MQVGQQGPAGAAALLGRCHREKPQVVVWVADVGFTDEPGEAESAADRQRSRDERPGELVGDGGLAQRPGAGVEGDADTDRGAIPASDDHAAAVAAARDDDAGERERIDGGPMAAAARADRTGDRVVEERCREDSGDGAGLTPAGRSDLERARAGAQPVGAA
jgi:hypothetical protein